VFRALIKIRIILAKDVPEIFSGTVEVDETYVGGQWKNKRKSTRDGGTKRGRGTKKQPVFGILCWNGQVWAEVVDDVEADTLQPLISRKVSTGSTICSDTWKAYTGIAARGYVHRLVSHGEKEYSVGKENHINGLEGFWGFLKRKLASKGGITKQKLPLYLAEYVWRYNHRNDSDRIKMRKILLLLKNI
jgi:transposase-like protein